MNEAIAITGMGIVSALGSDVRLFQDGLVAGRTAIRAAPWAEGMEGRKAWWGTVTDFDSAEWMDRKIEEGTDLFAQFASAAAQALRAVRLSWGGSSTGCAGTSSASTAGG